MLSPNEEIDRALDILALPKLITKEDIKRQYHFLAKKNHPDIGGDALQMEQLNSAYTLLMKYIEEFRYTFDEEEVSKQFPGADHAKRYK
ncbi:MAG: DnaJ domain-containing protein [Sulfurovum sp.]|nr:DnaJ domain-containing protein [Sulfurovum sp.]